MNITIITILLPYPLASGGAQAQYNMIDVLRHKHYITIIFPINGHNNYAALKELKTIWPEVTFRPYPYLKQLCNLKFTLEKARRAFDLYFRPKSNNFKVERILKPYGYTINGTFIAFLNKVIHERTPDIIQIEFYPYLKIIDYLPSNIKKIFIHHEIRFIRNERELKNLNVNNKQKSFSKDLKSKEIEDLNKYDKVITLTNVDKKILMENGVKVPISVSPAAINTPILKFKGWNKTLVFLGSCHHTPNVEGIEWMSHQVLPLIDWSEKFHNISFTVIGAGWTPKMITGIPQNNLRIMGFVKDIQNIAYGGIMVVPILSGSGMRMKILEAAAMGMPIVSTSVGKEGIDLVNGISCLIADTPSDFAEAITRLMSNEAFMKTIADNAQEFFKNTYSKEALVVKRELIYKKTM
jgi:glycosyltransferase involved in cell wall biosynthesis